MRTIFMYIEDETCLFGSKMSFFDLWNFYIQAKVLLAACQGMSVGMRNVAVRNIHPLTFLQNTVFLPYVQGKIPSLHGRPKLTHAI